jgi:hypothetical protein
MYVQWKIVAQIKFLDNIHKLNAQINSRSINYKVFMVQPQTILEEPDSINRKTNERKGERGHKTKYFLVQDNNSEEKHKHQGEDNEEQLESAVMSRWGEPVKRKTRESEVLHTHVSPELHHHAHTKLPGPAH